jgi:cytosine deaminase
VTSAARRALGLDPVAVEVGAPADLVAVRGASASAALAAASPERVVLAAGRVVARTKLEVSNALADRRLEGATWS